MKIVDLLKNKASDMKATKAITIAFLGDSVTQGGFECYRKDKSSIETNFDYNSAYSTRVREILNFLYPNVQINIINSGISGDTAQGGLERLNRDALAYAPDLIIVSYGLNDCNIYGEEGISIYLKNIEEIIRMVKQNNSEILFLTQNYYNTKLSPFLTDDKLLEIGKQLEEKKKKGVLKRYFQKAKEICALYEVKVCDMYEVWEKVEKIGVDTTELLANKLNHPVRLFHYYMAIKLIECILS